MMDEKTINQMADLLESLRTAPDMDHDYFKSEVKYILRLAWRTGVLDNIADTSKQMKKLKNAME